MYRHLAVTLLLATSLLLSACSRDVPRLEPLTPDAVILAFGDSLTFGSGAHPEASYPAILQQLTGRNVINAGVPGEISSAGLERLPELLDEHQPALLILCHGGNDFLRKLDKAQTSANLRAMIQLAQTRGIGVVLVAVPQPKLMFMEGAELYLHLASEMNLPLEDAIVAEVESDNSLKSDPIHPNGEGYRRMAQAIAELLKEAGAI